MWDTCQFDNNFPHHHAQTLTFRRKPSETNSEKVCELQASN